MPKFNSPMYTDVSIMVQFGPDSKTKVQHCADIVSLLSPSFGQATRLAANCCVEGFQYSSSGHTGLTGLSFLHLPYRNALLEGLS